ncbi:MAG: 16S rRNA (guanine(527)-N(7))-methyltransferase RsmG [Cypionkella sp.]
MIDTGKTELPLWLDVSRETHERLVVLLEMVRKWNPAINLVGSATLDNGWDRHVLDSAQLFELGRIESGVWVDFGSGAGFPGLVLAAIAAEKTPGVRFVLIEADRRKATFLMQAAHNLRLSVQILTKRLEELTPMLADVITARAFASLDHICGQAAKHLVPTGTGVFSKGANHESEIAEAKMKWSFDCEKLPSRTDNSGVILRLRNIIHA